MEVTIWNGGEKVLFHKLEEVAKRIAQIEMSDKMGDGLYRTHALGMEVLLRLPNTNEKEKYNVDNEYVFITCKTMVLEDAYSFTEKQTCRDISAEYLIHLDIDSYRSYESFNSEWNRMLVKGDIIHYVGKILRALIANEYSKLVLDACLSDLIYTCENDNDSREAKILSDSLRSIRNNCC